MTILTTWGFFSVQEMQTNLDIAHVRIFPTLPSIRFALTVGHITNPLKTWAYPYYIYIYCERRFIYKYGIFSNHFHFETAKTPVFSFIDHVD